MGQASQVLAFVGQIHRAQLGMCLEEESVGRQCGAHQAREHRIISARRDASRQHQPVRLEVEFQASASVGHLDLQATGVADLRLLALGKAHEQNARLARLLIVDLAETVRANVAVEHHHTRIWFLSLQFERVFDSLGTAHAAAIGILLVAAVHTLDHHHLGFGRLGQAALGQLVFQLALREHRWVLAVEVGLGGALAAARGQHHHAVIQRLLAASLLDNSVELADVAGELHDLGLAVHGDLGMPFNLPNQLGQEAGHIRTLEGVADLAQLAAQLSLFFDQVNGETLVSQAQRRGHARQAAAQNQRCLRDRLLSGFQRLEAPRAAHGHVHEIDGLFRGGDGIVAMDPRALIADVGHREQVGIESRVAQGFLEENLVRARRTRSHHQAVQLVLADHVLDVLLVGIRAGVQARLGVRHARHLARTFRHLIHVHHGRDVVAAVADEHAHARLLVGDIAFPGVLLPLDQVASHGREAFHGQGRGAGGLRH